MKFLYLPPVLASTFAFLVVVPTPWAQAQVRPATPPPPGAVEGHEADIAAGRAAAEAWLALVDAGEYSRSWREASSVFQSAATEAQWAGGLNGKRLTRGKALARSLSLARFSASVPGASTGRYVLLQFQTQFENKTTGTETLVSMLDRDGRWKVGGYYIK